MSANMIEINKLAKVLGISVSELYNAYQVARLDINNEEA